MFFKKPTKNTRDPEIDTIPQDFNIDKDISAIIDFIRESTRDIKEIYKLSKQLQALREKEKQMGDRHAPEPSLQHNVKEQIETFDKLLETYEFFDEDVEVNKQRMKFISRALKKHSQELKVDPELLTSLEKRNWWKRNS
jgi:DNA repair ATPase RecN